MMDTFLILLKIQFRNTIQIFRSNLLLNMRRDVIFAHSGGQKKFGNPFLLPSNPEKLEKKINYLLGDLETGAHLYKKHIT